MAAVKPFGMGVEATVAVGVTVGGGREWVDTESKATEVGDEIPVLAGTAVALFQMKSDYRIYRQGSDVPIPNAEAMHSEDPVWAYYRMPGWTAENNCGRSDQLLKGPMELEKDKKYSSASENHYLMWNGRDLAIYTNTDNAVWSFRENFKEVVRVLSVEISEDGQITVNAHRLEDRRKTQGRLVLKLGTYDLVKNPNRPQGTAIHLDKEGVLQVVAPTGRVVWETSSK